MSMKSRDYQLHKTALSCAQVPLSVGEQMNKSRCELHIVPPHDQQKIACGYQSCNQLVRETAHFLAMKLGDDTLFTFHGAKRFESKKDHSQLCQSGASQPVAMCGGAACRFGGCRSIPFIPLVQVQSRSQRITLKHPKIMVFQCTKFYLDMVHDI